MEKEESIKIAVNAANKKYGVEYFYFEEDELIEDLDLYYINLLNLR